MFGLFGIYTGLFSIKSDIVGFHAYPMLFIIFIQFFFGFLYTTFPKFLAYNPILPKTFRIHFFLYFFSSILYFVSNFFTNLTLLSTFFLLVSQVLCFFSLLRIYCKSKVKTEAKYDPKWMLIALFFGILSHLFFLCSKLIDSYQGIISNLFLYTGFYLFLFLLIFAVSQRMIPFFTSMRISGYEKSKSKWLMEVVFFFLFIKVLCIVFFYNHFIHLCLDLVLTCIFTYEIFFKWKLPFKKSFSLPILFILHLSLIWVPIGFFLSFVESLFYLLQMQVIFQKAVIHTLAIGYFLTILVGFSTRVILGHSGRVPHADKFTSIIFLLLQIILLIRVFASFTPNFSLDYIFWIQVSAVLAFITFLSWFLKYFRILCGGK